MMIRRTLPRFVVVAAAAGLLLTVVSGAQAQPGGTGQDRADGTATSLARADGARGLTPEEKKFGIPAPVTAPPPSDPYNLQSPYDVVQEGSSAQAAASKVSVTLPMNIMLTYVRTCGRVQGFNDDGSPYFMQFCCPDGKQIEPDTKGCNPDLIVRTPRTSSDDLPFNPDDYKSVGWTRNDATIWAASPAKSARPYGVFPPVRVSLLAFGAVPATAVLHISQPTDSRGQVIGFRYLDLQSNLGMPSGTRVAGFPYALSDTDALFYSRTLSGPLDIRVSDVKVDGRAVDVGQSCRTARPATLRYSGPRGIANQSQTADELEGRPGEFDPLSATNPGAANGVISIPSFSGCRDGARSLDPLISALASGPSNRIRLKLKSGAYDCARPDNPVGGCPDYPGYDGPIVTPAVAKRAALAGVRGSAQGLRRALRTMSPPARRHLISMLPATLRTLVTATQGRTRGR